MIPPGPVITCMPILPDAKDLVSSAPLKVAFCREAILKFAIQSSQKAHASTEASESSAPFLPVSSMSWAPIWVTKSQILCHGSNPSAGAIAVPHVSLPLVIALAASTNSFHVLGGLLMPAAWSICLLITMAYGLPLHGTPISLSGEGPLIASCGWKNAFLPPSSSHMELVIVSNAPLAYAVGTTVEPNSKMSGPSRAATPVSSLVCSSAADAYVSHVKLEPGFCFSKVCLMRSMSWFCCCGCAVSFEMKSESFAGDGFDEVVA